jgi:hypothetical protein
VTASSPTVSPLVDVSAAVDQIQGAWGARVAAGIRRLAEPPDWLTSVADPGRVSQALRHWVPELASGAVRLLETDPKRLRIKQETWTSLYRLTVKDSRTGRQRVVRVRGDAAACRLGGTAAGIKRRSTGRPRLALLPPRAAARFAAGAGRGRSPAGAWLPDRPS